MADIDLAKFFTQFQNNQVLRVFHTPFKGWEIESWTAGSGLKTMRVAFGKTLQEAVNKFESRNS